MGKMKIFSVVLLSVFFACSVHAETTCDAGYYLNGETCTVCPAGYYCTGGTATKTACPRGTYNDTTGAMDESACKTSDTGTYVSECTYGGRFKYEGCTTFVDCPDGYRDGPGTDSISNCQVKTTPGTHVAKAGGGLVSCPSGSYCPGGIIVNYNSTGGIASCIGGIPSEDGKRCGCSTNYYLSDVDTCTACSTNTYNTDPYGTQCTPCPIGTGRTVDQAECTPCAMGYYNNTPGTTCTYCPRGTYNDTTGATECKEYMQGQYLTGCEAGRFGTYGCTGVADCPAGTYGTEIDSIGRTTCPECPYGTYNDIPGAIACREIEPGKTCTNKNSDKIACASVADCPIGTYSNPETGFLCTNCPVDTYNDIPGSGFCSPCPNDWKSPGGATDVGDCGRMLNYQPDGATTPTKIYLHSAKKTSPSLAALIGDKIFYGNMTPVSDTVAKGLYISYNNQKYIVHSKESFTVSSFIITTTPDTNSFSFTIRAAGNFTIDWGDGSIEYIVQDDAVTENTYSHDYYAVGEYKIGIGGRASEYYTGGRICHATISFSKNTNITAISGSLGEIFPTLDGVQPCFGNTFSGCVNLSGKIPSNLFAGISGQPLRYMFYSTFSGCSGLTGEIPVGLFGDLSGAPVTGMFNYIFSGCGGLTGPTARMSDGTRLYDVVNPETGQTWYEQMPSAFSGMYDGTGISD